MITVTKKRIDIANAGGAVTHVWKLDGRFMIWQRWTPNGDVFRIPETPEELWALLHGTKFQPLQKPSDYSKKPAKLNISLEDLLSCL